MCIDSMSAVLNGCTLNIAARREFWAKHKQGGSFPVASVCDASTEDLPWYDVYVIDYKGNKIDFTDLCEDSQEELFSVVVEELY